MGRELGRVLPSRYPPFATRSDRLGTPVGAAHDGLEKAGYPGRFYRSFGSLALPYPAQ
jgi:hypothetical protein